MLLKSKVFIVSIVLLVMMLHQGCNETWDDHYNTLNETTEKEKVLAEMENIPEISKFTEAVKNIEGLEELLNQNRLFTIFAPVNEEFEKLDPAILNNKEVLDRLVLYHFIEGKYKYKDFSADIVTAFNGKYMTIAVDSASSDIILHHGSQITTPDFLSLNGMIHVIDKPLVPLNDLYEHFKYNDYAVKFTEAIDSYTDYVFNKLSSTPIGKNDEGELIYDSVFYARNPFLKAPTDLVRRYSIINDVIFKHVNIANENDEFTFVLPTNFNEAIDKVNQSDIVNSPIDDSEFASPILANMVMEGRYSKSEILTNIALEHSQPDADTSEVQLYFSDLMKSTSPKEVELSNGVVYEVDDFEYDLKWLIKDAGGSEKWTSESNYQEYLLSHITFSENIDTVLVSALNIKTIFSSQDDVNDAYLAKIGEWVNFKLYGDIYPVDYKIMVRGRNVESGKFKVEVDGKVVNTFDFSTAPSGDLDTQFDEVGVISFNEKTSSTDIKFIFEDTHSGGLTGNQNLWIREIKLTPILQ